MSELEYGVRKSEHVQQNSLNLLKFIIQFEIVSFNENAAREYGIIRADLEKRGEIIGNMDLLIVAHVKSLGTTLVTNNEKEFKRIKGFTVENWVAANK